MRNANSYCVFNRITISICLLFFTGYFNLSFAQSRASGKVTDPSGSPLYRSTITIARSGLSALTDSSGRFSIEAKAGDLLAFSFIGYEGKTLAWDGRSDILIVLAETTEYLNDVVLVGYGTARRNDITGAVDRITRKDFNSGIITSPMQQLQGKIAGLQIVQPGGDPNGDLIIRLRGATSIEGQPPLIVIDGIAIDDSYKALNYLNPADIESYDILKDASSAAIYGARGANGVILITTRKTRQGPVMIQYNGFVSMEQPAQYLDLLNADEWRQATQNTVLDAGGNVDWQKEFTRQAFSQSHSIGVSGGGESVQVQGTLGYLNQEGIIPNSGKEMLTGRLTANQRSRDKRLEVFYGINLSLTNRDFLVDQTSTSQSRTFGNSPSGFAPKFLPVWPVYNPDGSYYVPPTGAFNPAFVVNEPYNTQKESFFQASAKTDYELSKGLKLGFLAGFSRGNDDFNQFYPVAPNFPDAPAQARKASYNRQAFTGDLHGTYHKQTGKHGFTFTGVYEYNQFTNDGFGVTARGFIVPELLTNNLGAANNVQTNDIFSYKNEVKLISFLARAVYQYDDRFIFTANFRRDGSSKFGPNHQWANFPSVALAWRLNNEQFLEAAEWINNLKLRVSFGYTGNQENLAPYQFQQLYGPAGPYLYNNQFYQSYAVTQEYNPDLKWEVRQSFNIGLDFVFFKNRIWGALDFYNDRTDDMLYQYNLPQPPFLTGTVTANAASAVNKGFELTLNADIIRSKSFSWNTRANFSILKNKITGLLGQFKGVDLSLSDQVFGYASGGVFGSAPVTKLEVGYPAGVFWIPEFAGLDANGNELFNNYGADGSFVGTSNSFSNKDLVYIDPTPDFTWGITNNFRYKLFDLGFQIRGVSGQKIFNNTLLQYENKNYLPGSNVTRAALNNGFANLPSASSYWLHNASFARLDYLTLGYQFSNLKKITSLHVYITATNLFVITPYTGNDPEISTDGRQRYIDLNVYPRTRGFMFGINTTL